MEIKDIIKTRRFELGMTQAQLATAVGVSEATISRWESGDISNMKRTRIASLAKALKISPAVIMGWDEEFENTEEYRALHRIAEDMYTAKAPGRMAEDLSAEELEIVSILRKMSPEQLARELAYLRQAAADGQDK